MLFDTLDAAGPPGVVYEISHELLGGFGGLLAVIGVVICPITSGDTAFRSTRLILSEWTGLDQRRIRNRMILTLPILGIAALLTQIDFDVLWRYFSWSNQTLAMISLWVATSYLVHRGRYKWGSLITALPATFMSAVTMTYILMADEGFRLDVGKSYVVGITFAAFVLIVYFIQLYQWRIADDEIKENWEKIS